MSSPPSPPIRVVVCDDVADIRALLRASLEADTDLDVVGEADNGLDGIRIVRELEPDVVVLDLSMPGVDGLEAIDAFAEACPGTGIVVFSGFGAGRMRELTLRLGADRYVEKGEAIGAVSEAVRTVVRERRGGGARQRREAGAT
jgi:DNA-binding NarL/FixJ family response regulator